MTKTGPYAGGRLSSLLQRAVDSDVSERELSRRAERAGHAISNSQLNEYRRGIVTKAPDGQRIAALAAALEVPEAEIRRAVVIDWFEYDPAEIAGGPSMVRYSERIDMLLDALGTKLTLLSDERQREVVNEIMRNYVVGAL